MNIDSQAGYFTEEQMDRCNLKTMANPLPYPWDGHHLMALLVLQTDLSKKVSGLSHDVCKQETVDWYCTSTVETVLEALNEAVKVPQFHAICKIQEMMHSNPDEFLEFVEQVKRFKRQEDDV